MLSVKMNKNIGAELTQNKFWVESLIAIYLRLYCLLLFISQV